MSDLRSQIEAGIKANFNSVRKAMEQDGDVLGVFGLQLQETVAAVTKCSSCGFSRQDIVDQFQVFAETRGLVDKFGQDEIQAAMEEALREPPPAITAHSNGNGYEAATLLPPEVPRLEFVNPADWDGIDVPPRQWLVRERIPMGNVTLLNGDGAAGKTTIALQLAVATVRGTDWLGALVERQGPAIFLTAEEDQDEIHRRLDAITRHLGLGFPALASLHLLCMPGDNPVLGAPDKYGIVRPTPLFNSLLSAATEIAPGLIVIEAAADVFAGNENDRAQVRAFIGLLRRLALTSGAAVVLIAHPSLHGLTSGSGTSGSTGWNNSARARLYFTSAKPGDNDAADSDVRELRVMKSNYGPAGETVRLRWQRGVFVPVGSASHPAQIAAEADVDNAYLDCLDATTGQGRNVFPLKGRGFAPEVFARMPQARHHRKAALIAAQERLFAAGRIHVETIGRPSKQVSRIARKSLDMATE